MALLSFALPVFLFLALTPILMGAAPALGLLDLPDARKRHAGAVPLVGGLAMFGAFVATCVALDSFGGIQQNFIAGATVLLIVGVIDDRQGLPALPRFFAQALAVWWAVASSGNVLAGLGSLVSPQVIGLGALALPFTVFGVLGVVNAVNLIDGADGLAGGVAFTALGWFLVVVGILQLDVAAPTSFPDPTPVLLALMGAVLGFLILNLRTPLRRRASLFMGDGGSLFIGFALGWFAVALASQFGYRSLSPVAALWILIVPLFDTVMCMTRRVLEGRSPMSPDRKHMHHLVEACGLTTGRSVAVLIAVNALGGLVGVAAWRLGVPDYALFGAIAVCFVVYAVGSTIAWKRIETRAPLLGLGGAELRGVGD